MAEGTSKSGKSAKSRGLRGRSTAVADWGRADGSLLVQAVERASITGGAVRLGYSRDGGAFAIGIYGDGEPYTEYLPPDGDLDEWLRSVIDLYQSIYDDQMAARGGKKSPPQGQ